jgi:hypothetical protein
MSHTHVIRNRHFFALRRAKNHRRRYDVRQRGGDYQLKDGGYHDRAW